MNHLISQNFHEIEHVKKVKKRGAKNVGNKLKFNFSFSKNYKITKFYGEKRDKKKKKRKKNLFLIIIYC